MADTQFIHHIRIKRGNVSQNEIGTVEIEDTRLPGMKDFTVVDAHHTFICNHPRTISQTIAFLKTGRFENRQREETL